MIECQNMFHGSLKVKDFSLRWTNHALHLCAFHVATLVGTLGPCSPNGHEVACFSFHVCQCWKKCIKNARVYLFVAGSTSNEQLYGVNSRQVPWRMMSCHIFFFATESK